jgi:hypothetical protein
MAIAAWLGALLVAAAEPTLPPPPPGAPPATTPAATQAPLAKDPAALALVKKMCDRVRTAKTFSFEARIDMELPVAGGSLATFSNTGRAVVRRPDGLVASREGDLPEFHFAYDGKVMTILAPGQGRWGTTSAPRTLEEMIRVAGEQGDLSFPFDELLVADPYALLTRDLGSAILLGRSTISGRKVDHLLLVSPAMELQLWLDVATSLPARVAVVYADESHRPHFSAEYSAWKLDPKLPASTFALPKPAGASQVDFRTAAGAFR